MSTYTATLFDCPIVEANKRQAEVKFCERLEAELGGADQVVLAYQAYQSAFELHGEIPLPDNATEAEKTAVNRWLEAESAATTAVFAAWHGTRMDTLGGAHFEVSV